MTPDRQRVVQERSAEARDGESAGANRRAQARARAAPRRLGREPDQHRAHLRRAVAADRGRGLDSRRRPAISRARTTRSCGITTSRTAISADRAPPAWATARRPRSAPRSRPRRRGQIVINVQMRRRSQLCARRAVDGAASPAADAHGHAQQPRLASGADVRRVHVRRPRPRHRPWPHRHHAARSVHRLPDDGGRLRHGGRGPDHRSREARRGAEARPRLGQDAGSPTSSTSSRSRADMASGGSR